MLFKCTHLNNNEVEETVLTIKKLVNLFKISCKEMLALCESIVIDEMMMPWRGRLVFRQFNLRKTYKYGEKNYKLCTENTRLHL